MLGLGNTILSDDGVGIYVAREIGRRWPILDVRVEEASVGGLELLDRMAGFDRVILIDAVQTGRVKVGSLVTMRVEDLVGGSAMARHQVPFHEALMLGRKLGMDLPDEIKIYGVEVKDILTFAESCTPEVAAVVPAIAEAIVRKEFEPDGRLDDAAANQGG